MKLSPTERQFVWRHAHDYALIAQGLGSGPAKLYADWYFAQFVDDGDEDLEHLPPHSSERAFTAWYVPWLEQQDQETRDVPRRSCSPGL